MKNFNSEDISRGQEINKHQLAEEILKASEERYRNLFENANDIVYIQDPAGQFLDINKAGEQLTGYSREELLSMEMRHLIVPKYMELGKQMLERNLQGITVRYELEIITKRGCRIPVEVSSCLIKYHNHTIAIQGSARDISKRKQAEKALEAEKEKLAVTLSSISDGVITTDNDGYITLMNQEAQKIFGWENRYARGKHILKVVSLIESRQSMNVNNFYNWLVSENREGHPFVVYVLDNSGRKRIIYTSFAFIKEKEGPSNGMVFIFRDVTELRQAEAQLALSQKLESIGQLAAGVAHEINNPMQYIGDNTYFLSEAFGKMHNLINQIIDLADSGHSESAILKLLQSEETKNELDFLQKEVPLAIRQSLEGIEAVRNILTALRNFAHPGTTEKQAANINNGIRGTVAMSKNEWKHVADLKLYLEEDLPNIKIVANEINQVIINMIVNASHTIKEAIAKGYYKKGLITIETRSKGAYIEILISDNGLGIRPDIIDKIFDPFFTTKDVGKGTGQGLAISHDIIVNKHNGIINVDSELGRGTTFCICLPLDSKECLRAGKESNEVGLD